MSPWPLRPRQPFTGLALSAALGILCADYWPMPIAPLFAICGVATLALIVHPRTPTCWFFAALSFFTLHTLSQHKSMAAALAAELGADGHSIHASGIVWSEPEAPQFASKTVTARFQLKMETCQLDEIQRGCDMLV